MTIAILEHRVVYQQPLNLSQSLTKINLGALDG